MAIYSSNTRGNNKHSEINGRFLPKIKDEISNKSEYNDKQQRSIESISKQPGVLREEKLRQFLYSATNSEINFFLDDFYSIPLLMKQKSSLLNKFFRSNLHVNTDTELDKAGVDIIAYDSDSDNFRDFDLIDVKTGYSDSININIIGSNKNNVLWREPILGGDFKINDYYVLQIIEFDDINLNNSNLREIARRVISPDLKPNPDVSVYNHTVYGMPIETLTENIYSNVSFKDLNGFADYISENIGDLNTLQSFFAEEGFDKHTDVDGNIHHEFLFDSGLKLCCMYDPKNVEHSFRSYFTLSRDYLKKYFPANEITYSNYKKLLTKI